MTSLVPRLPLSFPSLAYCTANDGKLDGAYREQGWWYQIPRVNLAARTCRRQHGLRPSKEWPLSQLKWLKIVTRYSVCQWKLHDDGQPFLETARLTWLTRSRPQPTRSLQATESWAGPGNEASARACTFSQVVGRPARPFEWYGTCSDYGFHFCSNLM